MVKRVAIGEAYSLEDGLGVRRLEADGHLQTEVLDLAPVLAAQPILEQALRGRTLRLADLDVRTFAPVRKIERSGASLSVVTEIPAGIRLSHLLAHLESTGEVVPEAAMLELASLIVTAVASLHSWPGGLAHGAINPAHVLLTAEGRVTLTDCVFGAGLEVLQRNREGLWKDFGLAMPAAASLARFDQQADVTQLGAVVLAIVLQRPLRAAEYPRGIADLVVTATDALTQARAGSISALRMWLQEALQTHPRLAFRSAVEAQRSFADIHTVSVSRRTGLTALQEFVQTAYGEALKRPTVVVTAPLRPAIHPIAVASPPPVTEGHPFDSILRAVFAKH